MASDGLKMKYFVLNPNKQSEYGEASRRAIYQYADHIEETNPDLAHELRIWMGQIIAEHTHGE